MKKRVVCKFQTGLTTEPSLSRKWSNGGCSAAREGDVEGQTGTEAGYTGTYRVISQRNVSMYPVVAKYDDPDHENNSFFSSTPSGQFQLFSVMNMNDLPLGAEVRITLEWDLPGQNAE